jgi:hypothetical protein
MGLSTGITLAQVDQITSSKYGFNVRDRDEIPLIGSIAAKYSFDERDSCYRESVICDLPTTLAGKTSQEIADIFNTIFQKYHHVDISNTGLSVEAKIFYMRTCDDDDTIPVKPLIYILGTKYSK